jgi:SAM-dependent methyltransferase
MSSASKPILDACCGSRMFWFNKNNPLAVFCDIRKEAHTLCDGRQLKIEPDVVADFKSMPWADESFWLCVFDPPHLKNAGPNGWQAKKYGSLKSEWQAEIKQGFDECMRVLKPNGTLIFKWNEHSIKVSEVIKAIGAQPLFGHRTGQSSKTMWMTFFKQPPPRDERD